MSPKTQRLPLLLAPYMPLRIAAGYMLVVGITGVILPWLPFGPNYAEFRARSAGYKLGARAAEVILSAGLAVAGIGLFHHHAWARTLALALLLIDIPHTAKAFAWGFAERRPARRILLVSWIVVAAWNSLWFFVIYRLTV